MVFLIKRIKCLFDGHEMTENKQISIDGARAWKCKRCSFGMFSHPEESFEGVKMILGGVKKG